MSEQQPTPEYYRRMAKQMRELAGRAQLPEVRRELLEFAERFHRMAEYVERRYPERRGIVPSKGDPEG